MDANVTIPASPRPGGALVAGVAWLLSYFGARYAIDAFHPAEHWDLAIAAIPVLVFYWFVWAVQRALRNADELQRRIHLHALAMAFPATMLVLMLLGLLDGPSGGRLGLPLRDLWLALPLLYGLCYAVAGQRYR